MDVDAQLDKVRQETAKEDLKLKEKEQDVRLCELKIREVKRQLQIAGLRK